MISSGNVAFSFSPSKVAVGGTLSFPHLPANLPQKPLLADPNLGPPDLPTRLSAASISWREGAQTPRQLRQFYKCLQACQHFFLKYSSIKKI